MAERLNRVLADKNLIERRYVQELMQEIRALCLSCLESPPKERAFIEVDTFKADIHLLSHRTPFEPVHEREIKNAISAMTSLPNDLDLGRLYNQFYIDKTVLKGNVEKILHTHDKVSLSEVLDEFPVEKGLTEILAYLNIASLAARHSISRDEFEFVFTDKSQTQQLKIPKVIFSR
jgi:hypothetical protein